MKNVYFLIFLSVLYIIFFQQAILLADNFTLLQAIDLTLEHSNDILIQKENVKIAEGGIKISQDKFDTVINPSVSYQHSETPVPGIKPSWNKSDTVTTQLNVSKQFRTGITAGVSATTSRQDYINPQLDPINTPALTFIVSIPLLEGLGSEAAAAKELAAKSSYIQSGYTLAHFVSQILYQTTVYYWNYLLAIKNLKEYEDSLKRTSVLIEQVNYLIEKNARPKADIEQILASYANKKSIFSQAKQDLISSKSNLAILIGLPADKYELLENPVTDVLFVKFEDILSIREKLKIIKEQALKNRNDYVALKQAEKTAKINLVSAIDKLKNNLDLNINAGYQWLEKDNSVISMFDSFGVDRPGFNLNILLNYRWPVQNSLANGLVIQNQSLLKQAVYNIRQSEIGIYTNIETAVYELENTYDELIESQKAVSHYKKAINDEKEKYKLGISTIIDIINLEEKLTTANLNEISARYQFAAAIVALRYQTGKIVEKYDEKGSFIFDLSNFVSLGNMY